MSIAEAIMYELQRLQMEGFTPTRILVTHETLEAMYALHRKVLGAHVQLRTGTFSGLPVLPVDNLTANFEIAVQPTR